MPAYTLHQTLKKLRLDKDLNQIQLAEALGISRSYLCELESGTKKPSFKTLDKYSDFFGKPLSTIFLMSEQEGLSP